MQQQVFVWAVKEFNKETARKFEGTYDILYCYVQLLAIDVS